VIQKDLFDYCIVLLAHQGTPFAYDTINLP
jgi:hypothetical protein